MIYLKGFLKIHFIKAQHSLFYLLTLLCVQCTDKYSSSSTLLVKLQSWKTRRMRNHHAKLSIIL